MIRARLRAIGLRAKLRAIGLRAKLRAIGLRAKLRAMGQHAKLRAIGLVALGLAAASPALAHDLRVFASVTDDTVVVEASFSSGRLPVSGKIRVFDATETLIGTVALQEGGVTRFALPDGMAETGMMIEVQAGDGHSDYWMLTPDDIARGQEGD